ncbi:hypothetical protein FZEAL_6131 [Fusarium zealandicum]|uniref:CFEM domain-containing protein n=1 Tax=Fusarium zealandicum TaxID=1053134 RepID=A0A8H4UIE1_9HYPO|nr:hypothetical protein FZEAL_6131 [Fusarium zealandicum]
MKTSTSMRIAAAGLVGFVSMAQAQSMCAINCFQNFITDHPPLDCTEANMYLCFCNSSSLQGFFASCIWDGCDDMADDAIAFGVNLCAEEIEYGVKITPPKRPEEAEPTKEEETPTSTKADTKPEETMIYEQPEETTADDQPQTTKAATPEKTTKVAAPEKTSEAPAAETDSAEETKASDHEAATPKPTTVVLKPSHADNSTSIPTRPPVVVNTGASNVASGVLALAGVAMAVVQLLAESA